MKEADTQDFEPITRENAPLRMRALWRDAEQRFGVGLTLHDHAGVFIMPDNLRLLPDCNVHRFPCCAYKQGKRLRCIAHCRFEAMERAATCKRPFHFRCWRGIHETVMPLFRGREHVATIFAGAYRDKEPPTGFSARYRKLYEKMAPWDDARGASLADALYVIGYALLRIADNLREQYAFEPGRRGAIRRFLSRRGCSDVGLEDLAEELGISVSRTSHLLHKLFGKGYAELRNEERVRRAEQLLHDGFLLKDVARQTGFRNEFYFSRVFKKLRGVPPGTCRR